MPDAPATIAPPSEPAPRYTPREESQFTLCKVCNSAALPHSRFCESHQDRVAPEVQRRRRRIRRLDVILLLLLTVVLVGYPKIKGQMLHTIGVSTGPNESQGLMEDFHTLLVWLGVASKRDKGSNDLVASIRSALTSGGETTPPDMEAILQRAEANSEPLSLDEVIERLEGTSGAQRMGLSSAQMARLQALKGSKDPASAKAAGATDNRPAASQAAPAVAAVLARCGNGVVDPGEQCDGTALGGATCTSLGFSGDCDQPDACVHTGLSCLGNCRFDFSGCTSESQAAAQRFVDQGNGTATDRLTGLTWELKCTDAQCAERHQVLSAVGWQSAASEWIAALNAEKFAGHNDWRLPTLEELRTLLAAVPPCPTEPCAVAAWPRNSTAPEGYWSSTTFSIDKHRAWAVSFRDGDVYTAEKGDKLHVRAVRQGS